MEQAPRPNYDTIPEPLPSVEALHRTVVALKQTVEQMIGLRGRSHGGLSEKAQGVLTEERKATIHVTGYMPHADIDGDFWLCKTGQSSSLSVAINGKWEMIWP